MSEPQGKKSVLDNVFVNTKVDCQELGFAAILISETLKAWQESGWFVSIKCGDVSIDLQKAESLDVSSPPKPESEAPEAPELFTSEDRDAIDAARAVARKAFNRGESKSPIEGLGLNAMNALADLSREIKRL